MVHRGRSREPAPSCLHVELFRHNSATPPGSGPPQHFIDRLPRQVQLPGDQRHLLLLPLHLQDHRLHGRRHLVGDALGPTALVDDRRRAARLDDGVDLGLLRCLACGDAFGTNLGLVARHGRQHVGDQTARRRAQAANLRLSESEGKRKKMTPFFVSVRRTAWGVGEESCRWEARRDSFVRGYGRNEAIIHEVRRAGPRGDSSPRLCLSGEGRS